MNPLFLLWSRHSDPQYVSFGLVYGGDHFRRFLIRKAIPVRGSEAAGEDYRGEQLFKSGA
jgi:hypothetical protein